MGTDGRLGCEDAVKRLGLWESAGAGPVPARRAVSVPSKHWHSGSCKGSDSRGHTSEKADKKDGIE